MALTGCASLPDRTTVHAPASFALAAPAEARLAVTAREALVRARDLSAFRLLPVASVSYETLIELAAQAQRSLDLQTFVLHGDDSGTALLKALREASARGVRVRVLIDDLHTDGAEALLSDMAAFDRIEVRLINPFVRLRGSRGSKLVSSLDQLGRVNHRMHNKLFIADNALAVIGGRNIGDAYFMRAWEGENFIDLDALCAGAVVDQMSASFDAYWNSEFAWPIDAIVIPAADPAARRASFDRAAAPVAMSQPDYGIPTRLLGYALVPDELRKGVLHMTGAQAEVVADPVDKLAGSRVASREGTVRAFIAREALDSALEVLMISPYYIPGKIGIESSRQQRRDGVRMRMLTNSLAATDEPVVHAGYVEYRRDLVEIGVEVYELSPALARQEQRLGRFGTSQAALHMKAMVFDQWALFLGSMNLDGRSERYNTEVGVMIRSTALAQELLWLVDFESSAYRVELGPNQRLHWVSWRHGRETVYDEEPEASVWRKLTTKILGLLIPHDWL
ncbi:MAG TPA: phospholipase D family protein [Burkholderiaceae bacterium]